MPLISPTPGCAGNGTEFRYCTTISRAGMVCGPSRYARTEADAICRSFSGGVAVRPSGE